MEASQFKAYSSKLKAWFAISVMIVEKLNVSITLSNEHI